MAKNFLNIYVALNISIIVLNVLGNIFNQETTHFLSNDDWLIFIIACGALAIVETLEGESE